MAGRRKVKFSLKYKIALLILSLIIVTMAVIIGYSLNMSFDQMKAQTKRTAKQATDTLSALRLVSGLKAEQVNWAVYEKYMDILAKLDKNIMLMAIYDESGKMMAFTVNEAEVKSNFKSFKLTGDKAADAQALAKAKLKDTLKVRGTIKIKGNALSEIMIKFSKKSYNKRMNIIILNMVILTVLLLAAGVAGAWYLANIITNNFNIIAAGMRKVAEGNLDVEVNVKSNDETGVLADDFNRMIVELKEKVRIKDAFETVADGLKDMDKLKKAYEVFAYQEMTDKITKGYAPAPAGQGDRAVFLFLDISQLNSFTFELVSEEFKDILRKFVEKISSTTLEYQGALFKVTERYVMVCFGYPFRHDDDMRRALIATIEIRKELVNLVKSKLTLGYNVEEFGINFIILGGTVVNNFVDKHCIETYNGIIDYLSFAARYGGKKPFSTDVFATKEVALAVHALATFDKTDDINMNDGTTFELFKLKGAKF